MMERNEIDDVVCEIMYHDGPDRHIDGHEILTDFICALLIKQGDNWRKRYVADKRTQFVYIP